MRNASYDHMTRPETAEYGTRISIDDFFIKTKKTVATPELSSVSPKVQQKKP